tara:strand:- start:62 stop:580 length:519 start_codon:yes stop_codon:yes gene_type:complete
MAFIDIHGEYTKPVLQIVSMTKTNTSSTTLTQNDEDGVGLDATITPKSTSSRILILASINFDTNRQNCAGGFRLRRGGESGTLIANADTASNRYEVHSGFGANADMDQSNRHTTIHFLDHPNTTSSTNYVILPTFNEGGGSMQFYLNRAQQDPNQNDDGRFVSTVTLVEFGN